MVPVEQSSSVGAQGHMADIESRVVMLQRPPPPHKHRLCWLSGALQVAALGRRRGTLRRLALRASGAYDPDVPLRFDLRPLAQARPFHERHAPHAPDIAGG